MGRKALEYPLVSSGTNEGDPLGFYLGLFTVSDLVVPYTESGEATHVLRCGFPVKYY